MSRVGNDLCAASAKVEMNLVTPQGVGQVNSASSGFRAYPVNMVYTMPSFASYNRVLKMANTKAASAALVHKIR